MDLDLDALITRGDGIVTRSEALRHVPRWTVDAAVRRGRLALVLPGVLVDAARRDDRRVQVRAALAYAGGGGKRPAALSHASGLAAYDLVDAAAVPLTHVTVPAGARLAGGHGIEIHTTAEWAGLGCRARDGLRVVGVEQACVTGWAQLSADARRSAVICAVRQRLTTPDRISSVLDRLVHVPGRRDMVRLCSLLADGAHSEFEIWGLQHFFTPELLARSRGQVAVAVGRQTFFIDRAFEEEMVAYELDGTRYHDGPEQRRRDQRRDAALATVGWQTLRLGFPRAMNDAVAARRELRQVLAVRRQQFGLPYVA